MVEWSVTNNMEEVVKNCRKILYLVVERSDGQEENGGENCLLNLQVLSVTVDLLC